MAEWTQQDSEAAAREGWDVFYACRASDEQYQIEKDDEAGIFVSDAEALYHVYDQALRGSMLHRRALLFVLRDDNVRA